MFKQKGVVIMHIHGGGFVAMSSSSHQNYTRIWANVLDVPVFSVDYRLSPKSAFPDALNDCWQVYTWLLEKGESSLGIKIDNIIVAGDSAGGNLAAALTIMCIKKKYKIPIACLMSYPATYVGPDTFVPSILLSLDDILLPSRFLKGCLLAYQGDVVLENENCNPDKLDLMSPLLADLDILKKFP